MVDDLDTSKNDSINAGSSTSSLEAGPFNKELTPLEPRNTTASASSGPSNSPKRFPVPMNNLIEADPSTLKFKQSSNSLESASQSVASPFY
ncbi:hypothetical protein JTB14_036739 [Gonioctena quinquepunctata]|nr:hypothetical protein JTB14_036739 [Gonioctena quinquepunctata]